MKIKPLHDYVIVKRDKTSDATKGGIFIPEAAKELTTQGEVLAAGPGKDKALVVKAGDRVLFGKYAGTELKPLGEDVILLRDDDVIGIVEEP